jgi:hypothetical protein
MDFNDGTLSMKRWQDIFVNADVFSPSTFKPDFRDPI